jgi:tRNA(Ile)-lysidine synthase
MSSRQAERGGRSPIGDSAAVELAMKGFAPELPLAVAYSGGADSTALLLACAERWPNDVLAVHVNHNLQPAAADFETHCRKVCTSIGVPLHVEAVDAKPGLGESPEAAARNARYRCFDALAKGGEALSAIKSVAIGHHADDQVETVLLALSRGAGLPGIAAMPSSWQRDSLVFHRPFLRVGRSDLRAWLALQTVVGWIEDPSNDEEHFTRNRIRARLLPALSEAFPAFRETFARSARHAAEAHSVLEEISASDLAKVGVPPVIARLQTLSPGRQALVLRRWLRMLHHTTPELRQLAELQSQITRCTTRGHRILIRVGAGFVQREGDVIDWYNSAASAHAEKARVGR